MVDSRGDDGEISLYSELYIQDESSCLYNIRDSGKTLISSTTMTTT